MQFSIGEVRRKIGEENRRRVMQFFQENPLATQIECANALGLNAVVVSRHVKVLRAELKRERA